MSQITFRRAKGWQDKLRSYRIVVDGKDIGAIAQKSEVIASVSPGKHAVQFRIDWCTSPELEVNVAEGETEVIACGPNANPFLSLFYISFLRGKYIWAHHVPAGALPFRRADT